MLLTKFILFSGNPSIRVVSDAMSGDSYGGRNIAKLGTFSYQETEMVSFTKVVSKSRYVSISWPNIVSC